MPRRLPLACVLLLALAAPAPAGAAQRGPVTIKGADGPGPARYDRVRLIKSGPAKADNVLVLMPGTSAGAGNTSLVGDAIAKRLRGWQVWSISRRETALADHGMLDRLLAGRATTQEAFDYYLGWIGNPAVTERIQVPADDDVAYTREWGMAVTIADLREVVRAAREGARTVVLGGHSLGGSIAVAYASWDFKGRPGARDLAGLVLVDGGSARSEDATTTREQAEAALAANAERSPFLDLGGTGLPWTVGVFGELGGALARIEPKAPSKFQEWPLLPATLKTPVPATTRGQFGYAIDAETSPEAFRLAQLHAGSLAETGEPRDWVNGELTTIDRAARVFTNPILGGTSWFHPLRLSTDSRAVNGGQRTPAQDVLGLRAWHGRKARLPIYAYETELGDDRVIAGARRFADAAGVPRRDRVFVDRSARESHLDPLAALPARNRFLETVVPFLERIGS